MTKAEVNKTGKLKENRTPVFRPFLVFLITLSIPLGVWWLVESEERARYTLQSELMGEQTRNLLESWMDERVRITRGLAEDWILKYKNDTEKFEEDANLIIQTVPGFQAIIWLDKDGRVQAPVSRIKNTDVENANLTVHPIAEIRAAFDRAQSIGSVARTRAATDLLYGGKGFAIFLPVRDENDSVLGFICSEFRIDTALELCLYDRRLRENYGFELSEADGEIVYSHSDTDADLNRSYACNFTFTVAEMPMRLTLWPANTAAELFMRFGLNELILLFGVVVAVTLSWLTRTTILRQRSIRQSAERLSRIYSSVDDGIFVFNLDDGCIVDFNPKAAQMLGYEEDELKGLPLNAISSGEAGKLHLHGFVEEVLREGKARNDKLIFIKKDGKQIPVEASGSILRLGNEDHALAMVRETSERLEAEHALRSTEKKYRELIELLPLIVFECDTDGVFTSMNYYGLSTLGYSQNELVGKLSLADILVTGDDDLTQEDLTQRLTGRFMQSNEYPLRRSDGSAFPGIAHARVLEEEGEATGLRGVILDISERKKAEEERLSIETQMQQAQKLESLGVLAGGIAHDFNNLLLAILGNADLALMELPKDSSANASLNDIVKSAQRAGELCNQMLAYSGRGKFIVKKVSLSELVEDMTNLLVSSISKNVKLKYEFPNELPPIEGDITQMRQIVLNLVTNASDAIGDARGAVRVRTGALECSEQFLRGAYLNDDLPPGLYTYLEVADTGAGMDEETLAKLFEPFFTTKRKGRGLGLSAVLGIIRSHRGAITVKSVPGEGTLFRVYLPALSGPAEKVAEEDSVPTEIPGTGTILVVEDEEMLRDLSRRTLEHAGYSVLVARDGREGVAAYRKNAAEIDAVLLDMTMPYLNGEEVFQKIHKINDEVKVILSSGYSEQDAAGRFENGSPAAFIQKPYRARDLLKVMEGILKS